MATYHTVLQGEHLSRIALRHGFDDYRIVWQHPENRELANLRQNPNVLLPGDSVFIPDKERKKEAIPTGRRHQFRLTAQPLLLRVVLKDVGHLPISHTACELHLEGKSHPLTTDGDGMIERPVPKTAEHGQITILDRVVPVRIGHLDPVEVVSGQLSRLNNLGYRAGTSIDPSDPQLRSAVEEFQCDHGLAVNGICTPETEAKLKEAHGC